ncbi:MAG: UDP-N-acetylmuramoyl-L-alanine--D-glutamate ligase [Rhodospirillales bacterium]
MIDLSPLPNGRRYAVLGLGRSGRATVQALQAAKLPVWAWDDNSETRERLRAEQWPLANLAYQDLGKAECLVMSPGIPHSYPVPHPVTRRARQAGCAIVGDGELFAKAHADARCIGITGTNGKSTTTALIGHILHAAGRPCAVGGNLGTPILALDPLPADGLYVFEMSSYQLELTPSLVFLVAVLLNITPDHLDRHGGMNGYIAAKREIFRGQPEQAVAVVGVDDGHCREIADDIAKGGQRRLIPISAQGPVPGGVYVENGTLFDAQGPGEPKAVLAMAEAPALPGEHNAQNAAAAYAATRVLGLDPAAIADAIRSFPGLPHRQELIAVIDDVAFVNDSKATNADAAAKALACYDAIYWIAGGRPKEGGLAGLDAYLPRIRHAFLIGEAAEGFAHTLDGIVPTTFCGTLDRAVAAAAGAAAAEHETHPVVLLSPACASFDQFANFEARGDAFRALVQGLRS